MKLQCRDVVLILTLVKVNVIYVTLQAIHSQL